MSGSLRVADLLFDPTLMGVRMLAGAGGMERQVIDVRWYDGALEQVTDTLVVCGADQVTPLYRLDALVRRTQEAGAAALLVVAEPGEPLLSSLRLADRLEIPVLWMTGVNPFRLALELTALVRAPEQIRARAVEQLLHALAAKRTGTDILATATSVLGATLSLITSDAATILGLAPPLDPWLRLDQPVPQRGDHVLIHPVLDPTTNKLAAWLVCPFERAADTRLDVLALGLAMVEPYLRSWLAGQRAQADRDSLYRSHLLTEIVGGGDTISRDVVEAAVSLGWRLQGWQMGIHVITESPPVRVDRDAVAEQLRAAFVQHDVAIVATVERSGSWASWHTSDTQPGPEEARLLLRKVRRAVAALPSEWAVVAGIGRPHHGPSGLAQTLSEARDAADLARSHDYRPAVEHSDELGVARLLATWQRSDVTRAFAKTALAPLSDQGGEHLLTTLHTYLECRGSVMVTAQTLGVHRNTVTSRIQQIRELLEVDLDDPSQWLALQVACRAVGL